MKKYFYLVLVFLPQLAQAHGVGQVYTLPIPLKYYLGSAGLAVAFSFFLFAFFLSDQKITGTSIKIIPVSWLKPLVKYGRVFCFLLLIFIIATGIFGNQNASFNITPIFFWVFFLLWTGILSLVVGNIWEKFNPFKFLGDGHKLGQRKISPWVGVALLLGLYWLELASGKSFVPSMLGGLLLIYTLTCFILPRFFNNWFADGDLFSVLFGFIGKIAPLRISDDERSIEFIPLTQRLEKLQTWPMLVVACILLSATSFDSFKETVQWFAILDFFGYKGNLIWPNTLGVILSPLPFLFLYLIIIWLMQKVTKVGDFSTLARHFVLSLIPIAFGYTLAHSFSLAVITTPPMAGLISDPFGFHWNIFGTAYLIPYYPVLNAKLIWIMEIGFVVVAHVVGTFFAHKVAINIFPNQKLVLRSQYPMLILMVAFTITTLWLLSQPLVVQ